MTHFLSTDENPDGYKLEDILSIVRQDIIARAGIIAGDKRPEALCGPKHKTHDETHR